MTFVLHGNHTRSVSLEMLIFPLRILARTFFQFFLLVPLSSIAVAQVTPEGGLILGQNTYVVGQPANTVIASLRQDPLITEIGGPATQGEVGTKLTYLGTDLKQSNLDSTIVFFEQEKVATLIGMKRYKSNGVEASRRAALKYLQILGPPAYFTVVKNLARISPAMVWKKQGSAIFVSFAQITNEGKDEGGHEEIKITADTEDALAKFYDPVSVTPKEGEQVVAQFRAATEKQFPGKGKVAPLRLNVPPPKVKTLTRPEVVDFGPTFISHPKWKALYFSYRHIPFSGRGDKSLGEDTEVPLDYRIMAMDRDGKSSVLLATPFLSSYPAWDQKTGRVAFVSSEGIYILDTKKFGIGWLNDGTRAPRVMPVWTPSGGLVVSGLHSPSDWHSPLDGQDMDLFMSVLNPKLQALTEMDAWCIGRLTGQDILPTVSPDGKWVAFAHSVKTKHLAVKGKTEQEDSWTLMRAPLERSAEGADSVRETILEEIPQPSRMRWLSNSQKLFLSYSGSLTNESSPQPWLEILDLQTGHREPIKVPTIVHPLTGEPLRLLEADFDEQKNEVLLSVASDDKKTKKSQESFIFLLNVAEQKLRLISPVEAEKPVYVQFSNGMNGLNAWRLGAPQRTKPLHVK